MANDKKPGRRRTAGASGKKKGASLKTVKRVRCENCCNCGGCRGLLFK